MDKMYANLRVDGREDEIPPPTYPQNEWDTCPKRRRGCIVVRCNALQTFK